MGWGGEGSEGETETEPSRDAEPDDFAVTLMPGFGGFMSRLTFQPAG